MYYQVFKNSSSLLVVGILALFFLGCSAPRLAREKHEPVVYAGVYPESKDNILERGPPFKFPSNWNKVVLVIDPGHGGEDVGTKSLGSPKYQEKWLNLSTAVMLKNYLKQFGCRVVMTREEDIFISLSQRANLANKLHAKLFISVHFNSAPSSEAQGIEVFYYRDQKNKERTHESKELAKIVLEKVILNTQAKSRGVKHGNFAVIRETEMPAILVEGGFLTNSEEMDKLKKGEYLKKIALGIAEGILGYSYSNGY